jgi:hypothetical protein
MKLFSYVDVVIINSPICNKEVPSAHYRWAGKSRLTLRAHLGASNREGVTSRQEFLVMAAWPYHPSRGGEPFMANGLITQLSALASEVAFQTVLGRSSTARPHLEQAQMFLGEAFIGSNNVRRVLDTSSEAPRVFHGTDNAIRYALAGAHALMAGA